MAIKAYQNLFIGYLITLFNIHIGFILLLPDFIGYIIMVCSVHQLAKLYTIKAYKYVSGILYVLIVESFIRMFIIEGMFSPIQGMLIGYLQMVLILGLFYFLIQAYIEQQQEEHERQKWIVHQRNWLIIDGISLVIFPLLLSVEGSGLVYILMISYIVSFCYSIWIMWHFKQASE